MKKYEFLPYLCDFYKTTHSNQYNPDVQFIFSNFVPRMSRLKGIDKVLFFGLQAFVRDKLRAMEENFFKLSKEQFEKRLSEYEEYIQNSLGETAQYVDIDKYRELYELGFLPIGIRGLKEGSLVPIHVPLFEIYNTRPGFAWVTNFLESYISAEMWYPITVATFAFEYRKVVHKAYNKTVDVPKDYIKKNKALNAFTREASGMSEFGTRGGQSMDSAIKASAAFLTCFNKSANVAAGPYIMNCYNFKRSDNWPIHGMVSTEHSVMCSNFAIDGDEETFFNKLITETYPTGNISVVADSYDYWNFVDNILPKFKDKILKRDGCVGIRGDSGDVVDIVVKSVEKLWGIFGGTTNSKGYKVLDPHIKMIYGDSITINRARIIYDKLEKLGFAASNVSLGAGSFSMLCFEDEEGKLFPFTRDTFGIAIKATHCVVIDKDDNKKEIKIFKNPKTDNENFKKSYKGRVVVLPDENNGYRVIDGFESVIPHEYRYNDLLRHNYTYNGDTFSHFFWNEITEKIDSYLEPLTIKEE